MSTAPWDASSSGRRATAAFAGRTRALFGCALVGAMMVTLVLITAPPMATGEVVLHALTVAIPIGLGLYWLRSGSNLRMAVGLIAAGGLAAVAAFAVSDASFPYTVGRIAVLLLEPVLVYLTLVFPLGRFVTSLERRLWLAAVGVAVFLYVPTAFTGPFPTPSPWATCEAHCPANAFALWGSQPGFVDDVVRPLREILTILIFSAVAAVLVRRTLQGRAVLRRTLAPLAVVASYRALTMLVYFPARAFGRTSGVADVLGWLIAYSAAAIAIAFVVGLIWQRVLAATALEQLVVRMRPSAHAPEIQPALGGALRDPTLRVLFWVPNGPGRWVDAHGWPGKAPQPAGDVAVTDVRSQGRLVAAIVHDPALSMDPNLVQTAAAYALTAVENQRLVNELQSSLRELSESRVRIVSIADRERHKIERDLHDGAQQRLVALRVKLELMAERLQSELPEGATSIRELGDEVDVTIDEVRSFARGVYPSLLSARGLGEALRAAGRSVALPTMVDASGLGRYPPEIESTVYFVCTEALQNSAKHAHDATGVVIKVRANGRIEFEVRDDGEGFDTEAVASGTGLASLRERVEAVGGTLRVESAPGRGAAVVGEVPVG